MRSILNLLGFIFTLAACYLFYAAWRMPIAVAAPEMRASGFLPQGMDSMVNLGMMHFNAMFIHLGIGAAIIAAIFITGGAIVGALEDARAPVTYEG